MATGLPSPSYRLDAENPWPGLAWFDESGASFFNGRRREITELRRLVADAPLAVLFGRSGLGKTSLLKAGLFPSLRQGNFLPVYVRFDFNTPRNPAAPPLIEQLFAAFTQARTSVGADAPARQDDESLWEYFHRVDVKVWSQQNEPLVPVFVVDQFEEVFTLGPANPQAVSQLREDLADLGENRIPIATERLLAEDERASTRFVLRSRQYRVLLSFREDFATSFERWHELPSLMRNRLQLAPMTGSQALDAVYCSAPHLMSADTAEQIVRFVASEKHAGPATDETETTPLGDLVVEPALLSLVCRGLNESRKLRRDSGGRNQIDGDLLASTGSGVVNWHYDTCMRDQPDRVHRFVECELITESGFRKPCAQDDAQREPYGVALDALRSLVDRRLIRIEPSLGVTRVELIHDLLTPTVVSRRDARRVADRKRQLEDELKKHEAERQSADAARRARRRTQIVGAVAAGAVVVTLAVAGLAVYAIRQERLANAAGERANAQARVAQSRELASAATTRLDLDPELAVRLALEAAKVSPTAQAESALRQALFRWRGRGTSLSTTRDSAPRSLPVRELKGHTDDVMSVAFSPDGRRLLTVSCDKTARLWDVAMRTAPRVLQDHRASISVGVFSRDGREILTAGGNPCITKADRTDPNDTDVRVWDAETGQVTARLSGSPNLLVSAAFNADRSEVAAGGVDGQLRIWNLATRIMRAVGVPSQGLQSIEYSPDGSQLAAGSLDGKVIVRNANSGETLAELRHNAGVLAIAYGGTAQTGVLLVSADLKGIAKLWDAHTFRLRRELNSYNAALNAMSLTATASTPMALNATALSRDSRFLVTASDALLIWDIDTGERLQAMWQAGGLYAASMSADGRMIAVGGPAGYVALLDCDICVPLDKLMKLATERSPRELTEQERKDFFENASQRGRP